MLVLDAVEKSNKTESWSSLYLVEDSFDIGIINEFSWSVDKLKSSIK